MEEKKEKFERIMVITAHPDDMEFMCGGTVAKHARQGAEITLLILTNGDKGGHDPALTAEMLDGIRKQEQDRAAAVLGVKRVIFFDVPDGDLIPSLEMRKKVVAELRRYRPEAVFTLDPTTYFMREAYINHADHKAAGEIALNALFPAVGNQRYHAELLDEGLEPHTVHHIFLCGTNSPNYEVDISDVIDVKLAAIRCHASQIPDFDRMVEGFKRRQMAAGEDGRDVYREEFRHLQIRG
jgi:LmbE family N-acetylglucosaminyl deacetylase